MGQFGVQQETKSLYYVRARWYDAANGRFLQKDPYPASLSNPQTLNRYVYGLNNPISRIDPLGLNSCSQSSGESISAPQPPSFLASIVPVRGSYLNGKYYFGQGNWFLGSLFFISAGLEAIPGEGEGEDVVKALAIKALRRETTDEIASKSVTTIYRAVDATELDAIKGSGKFSLKEGGVESKYFAKSVEDANWYGQKIYPNGYSIIEGSVKGPIDHLWFPNIDIGAYVFPTEHLPNITPIIH
jgi:RHS repeat-associated protein